MLRSQALGQLAADGTLTMSRLGRLACLAGDLLNILTAITDHQARSLVAG